MLLCACKHDICSGQRALTTEVSLLVLCLSLTPGLIYPTEPHIASSLVNAVYTISMTVVTSLSQDCHRWRKFQAADETSMTFKPSI